MALTGLSIMQLTLLRRFGHMERMDEYRMVRRVLMVEVECGYEVNRGKAGWMV